MPSINCAPRLLLLFLATAVLVPVRALNSCDNLFFRVLSSAGQGTFGTVHKVSLASKTGPILHAPIPTRPLTNLLSGLDDDEDSSEGTDRPVDRPIGASNFDAALAVKVAHELDLGYELEFEAAIYAVLNKPGHPGVTRMHCLRLPNDLGHGGPVEIERSKLTIDQILQLNNHPYMVMDYYPSTLHRKRHPPYTMDELVLVAARLIPALYYIHSAGLIHLDIKPTNILSSEPKANVGNEYAFADFGLAKFADHIEGSIVGTECTAAPEVRRCMAAKNPILGNSNTTKCRPQELSQAADWSSLGATLYTMALRYYPHKYTCIDKIDNRLYPPHFSKEFTELLDLLLAPNPQDRKFSTRKGMRRLQSLAFFENVNFLDRVYECHYKFTWLEAENCHRPRSESSKQSTKGKSIVEIKLALLDRRSGEVELFRDAMRTFPDFADVKQTIARNNPSKGGSDPTAVEETSPLESSDDDNNNKEEEDMLLEDTLLENKQSSVKKDIDEHIVISEKKEPSDGKNHVNREIHVQTTLDGLLDRQEQQWPLTNAPKSDPVLPNLGKCKRSKRMFQRSLMDDCVVLAELPGSFRL